MLVLLLNQLGLQCPEWPESFRSAISKITDLKKYLFIFEILARVLIKVGKKKQNKLNKQNQRTKKAAKNEISLLKQYKLYLDYLSESLRCSMSVISIINTQ